MQQLTHMTLKASDSTSSSSKDHPIAQIREKNIRRLGIECAVFASDGNATQQRSAYSVTLAKNCLIDRHIRAWRLGSIILMIL